MPIATLFGGSGFIGRYVAYKLARKGWRVRAAVRRPNEAMFLRPYGEVGQVEPVQANIRDEASTARALGGADAVVNLVGILYPTGGQTFDGVQLEGAERIARLCAAAGISNLTHVSAIGADAGSDIPYQRTKGEAERRMRAHVPATTVLRPSVVFGPEDELFNRFANLARFLPVMPVIGGDARFQPVYVGDVAEAVVRSMEDRSTDGETYELGGPDVVTMREINRIVMEETRRNRLLLDVPGWVARLQARVLELPNTLLGMAPILTRDQLRMLGQDNVVSEGAKGLADLGITPTAMEAVLETYLYQYRPGGQYARMKPGGDGQTAPSPHVRYTPETEGRLPAPGDR